VQDHKRILSVNECSGDVKIIPKALASLAGQALANIEDPLVIQKILTHLDEKAASVATGMMPQCRVPPPTGLFV
jgi:hypothetical protein